MRSFAPVATSGPRRGAARLDRRVPPEAVWDCWVYESCCGHLNFRNFARSPATTSVWGACREPVRVSEADLVPTQALFERRCPAVDLQLLRLSRLGGREDCECDEQLRIRTDLDPGARSSWPAYRTQCQNQVQFSACASHMHIGARSRQPISRAGLGRCGQGTRHGVCCRRPGRGREKPICTMARGYLGLEFAEDGF